MKQITKKWISSLLACALILGNLPVPALAQESDGLCDHHTQHTTECGYSPAVEGHECGHEHTEECYRSATECVHTHGDCGYVPAVAERPCACEADKNGEIVHEEGCGYQEAVAEVPCGHVCSEESGCVTQILDCQHIHDDNCGYVEAKEEVSCTFLCQDCEGALTSISSDTPTLLEVSCDCSTDYAGNYVVCNTNEVTIRDGHSVASNALGRIPLGTEISITKASGAAGNSDAWGHVTYNGVSGCIPMCYVKQQPESLGSGDCGANGCNVLWNFTSDGTLNITGSGEMADYRPPDPAAPWSRFREQITTIVIQDGVTSIGDCAFEGCRSLTSVSIPSSIPFIGWCAFTDCSSLTSVTIPNSVTGIGWRAFESCDSLTSVTIPDSVKGIGGRAFYNCENLSSVSIPSSVTSIGGSAFGSCSKLASLTIPSSVTFIDQEAFYACSKLTSVTIPNGVTSISYATFYFCRSLTSVDIPSSVTSIGDLAFCHCASLTSLTIPNSVTSIGSRAFIDCSGLTSVTIPNSVTTIDKYAFDGCTKLKDVYYNGTEAQWSQISIGEYNSELTNATIHYNGTGSTETTDNSGTCGAQGDNLTWTLTDDGTLTISGSGAMKNYTRATEIPWYSKRSQITSAILTDGVTTVGDLAFFMLSNLTSVTIPEGVTSIGDQAFADCFSLDSIALPDSVTSIGNSAFSSSRSLSSITLPDSVTSIGEGVFSDCTSLSSITLPDGVTSIGEMAFQACKSLSSITIPASVTSVGALAFNHCNNLTSVTLSDGITSIGYNCFSYCSSLSSITLPDSVTSIGDGVFSGCSSLFSITIPDDVTSIACGTFYRCSSLTSITIPNSVTSIGENSFYGCGSLKDVYFNGTEEQWTAVEISEGNEPLTNATIHYNSNELTLVSTSPAAGATNVALDEPLVLTFSQDISEQLDWSKGKLCIIDYDTRRSVLEIGADKFAKLGGYVDGDKIVIPSVFVSNMFLFSFSGKLSVRIPDGLISAKGTENAKGIQFAGINNRDDLTFTIKRNVISTGFDLQNDVFSFSNRKPYFDKPFYFSLCDVDLLESKLDTEAKLFLCIYLKMLTLKGFSGLCYGMSTLMGLLQTNRLDITQINGKATCAADLEYPKYNNTLYSYLSYYHFIQLAADDNPYSVISDAMQAPWGRRLVSWLKQGQEPVVVGITNTGGAHTILAYAIDEISDPDNYIIYVIDPNLLTENIVVDDQPVLDENGTAIHSMKPILLYVSKDTFRINNTYVLSSYTEEPNNLGYYYSEFLSVTSLSQFDDYSLQNSHVQRISVGGNFESSQENTLLITNATSFTVDSGEKAANVIDGIISGDLSLQGPYSFRSALAADGISIYLIEKCDTYTLQFDDTQNRTTYINFAGSNQAVAVESNAKTVSLTSNGDISISDATSRSNLYTTLDEDGSNSCAFLLETTTSDLILTSRSNGCYQIESSEPLGEVKAGSVGLLDDEPTTSVQVHGSSAIAVPIQGEQYEIYEGKNYTIGVGTNSTWQKGSKQALVFESNGPVDKFEKLVLDGADLAVANYTVSEKSGNTVISLKAEYLQTLDTGEHSLYFSFTDGKTSDISFTVEELFNRLDLSPYDDFNNQTEIFIDGVPYPIESSNGRYVNLPHAAAFATSYQIRNSNSDDAHLRYPEGMIVYRIVHSDDGIAKLEKIDAFTNLLQYSGSSIRITGKKGIRMITSVDKTLRSALINGSLEGFTLMEYGTLLAQTSKLGNDPLVLGGENVKSNYAYKKGVADPVFQYAGNLIQYTNVLVGFNMEQCKEDIAMRPYMKLMDENGEEFVIYGGIVYRSIGYIAWQNRDVFSPGTAAYNYVWDIIHAVYGDDYEG